MSKAISIPLTGRMVSSKPAHQAPVQKAPVVWSGQSAGAKSFRSAKRSKPARLVNLAVGGLILCQIIVGVVYLFGINLSAAKGYEVSEINAQLNKLKAENKRLALQIAEKNTLNALSETMPPGFVVVTQTEFAQGKFSNR